MGFIRKFTDQSSTEETAFVPVAQLQYARKDEPDVFHANSIALS